MPMPPGTYLKVKAGEKIKAGAVEAKKTVAEAKAAQHAPFYDALDRVAESKLAAWHKEMNALVDAIKKNAPLSKEDKVRKAVSDVLGEVKKILVKAKDLKALDATLQRPSEVVVRAPSNLGSGAELTLVIALVQVLSVLVRLRKSKSSR